MSTFGAALLIVFLFVRPQECYPPLEAFKLLYIAIGFGFLGIAIDFGTGKLKLGSPQWPIMIAYVAWNVLCTLVKVGGGPVADMQVTMFFPVIYFAMVMYAGRTFERYRTLAVVMLAVSVTIAGFICSFAAMSSSASAHLCTAAAAAA